MTKDEQLEKLKQLGEKYSNATEYFDHVIENDFIKMNAVTKKLVNQMGRKILQILAD